MNQKVTICPKSMIAPFHLEPEYIEKTFIDPLRNFISEVIKLQIELHLPTIIVQNIISDFPWNKANDNLWKQYLFDWQQIIWSDLEKCLVNIAIESTQQDFKEPHRCGEITCELNTIWQNFLSSFGSLPKVRGTFREGLHKFGNCSKKSKCHEFYFVTNLTDLIFVKYPWLLRYDIRLPTAGQKPFQPPVDWDTRRTIKGKNYHGFVDVNGYEWVWDLLHNDHWDVQFGNCKYLKVSPTGKLLLEKKGAN